MDWDAITLGAESVDGSSMLRVLLPKRMISVQQMPRYRRDNKDARLVGQERDQAGEDVLASDLDHILTPECRGEAELKGQALS